MLTGKGVGHSVLEFIGIITGICKFFDVDFELTEKLKIINKISVIIQPDCALYFMRKA